MSSKRKQKSLLHFIRNKSNAPIDNNSSDEEDMPNDLTVSDNIEIANSTHMKNGVERKRFLRLNHFY